MTNRVDFELGLGKRPERALSPGAGNAPMRLLVMADLSGRENRGVCHPGDLAERPLVSVDIDNLDDVIFRFAPRLELPVRTEGGEQLELSLQFKGMDDFHPDGLFARLEIFQALSRTRRRLMDPATYDETAEELKRWARTPPPEEAPADKPASAEPAKTSEDTDFDRLLGAPRPRPEEPATTRSARSAVANLIKSAVEPHIVPGTDPEQGMLVASIDDAMSEKMRAILHAPDFQALEAAWRGLNWLISSLDVGEDLKVFVLDVSKAELDADVAPNLAGLQNTQLYRALVEQGVGTLGGAPWTAIVGQFNFGANAADVQLLAGLGAVAASAGGPFLASAEPSVLGVHSPEDIAESSSWQRTAEADAAWQALRTSPVASWIGLALPRILLRLPYGEETDPADAFDFEEMPGGSRHEAYLWGNPAVGCALLLGTSFLERGESMEPGDDLDIDDLPAHVYEAEDGRTIKPCAEASVSERAAHSILAEGIMPVVSYRNRNSVRVLRFQSVAEPPAPLSGRWQ